MTGGFNLAPRNFEPAELGDFFVQFVIITAIVHAVIAGVFDVRKRKSEFEKDERDIEISRKGSHAGYSFFYFGIGAVVVTLIIQYVVGADYQGPVSVINPVEMVFALCVVSFLADLYRHGTIIWAYRE